MSIQIKKKSDLQELEKMFLAASYSGERFIVQRKDGVSIGIVPLEDIEILESLERVEEAHQL